MSKSNKTCLLFTLSYPYGISEPFLESEINYLAAYFKKVIIFPLSKDDGKLRELPKNVTIEFLFPEQRTETYMCKDVVLFLKVFAFEFRQQFNKMLNHFRYNVSFLKTEYLKAKVIARYLTSNFSGNDCIFYSYWFDTWPLMLSLVKVLSPEYKFEFYSRAHGFDVFEDQTKNNYHPFKNFIFLHVNTVYSVSDMGRRHMEQNYPMWNHKLKRSYLGSENHALTDIAATPELVIVTCANVRSIKRIDLIPQILRFIPETMRIKWVLIGGGELLEKVKESCKLLGDNIKCVFTGQIEPKKVNEFYSLNRVDLFLSVSRSEGIPFTMMEAISYGIPLMSTNVGGCSEICNEHTGVLIEKDFQPKDVAERILDFSGSRMNTPEFRQGVRKFWEEHFNAEKNYEKFYKEISLS